MIVGGTLPNVGSKQYRFGRSRVPGPKEVLIKSGSMRLQWEMSEFKAKIVRHSTAMAQFFNKVNAACGRDSALGYAEIVRFTCSIAIHGLISTSLRNL